MNIAFDLNDVEQSRYEEFIADVKKLHGEAGTFKFTFTPTGIGTAVNVFSNLAEVSRDITDYDCW